MLKGPKQSFVVVAVLLVLGVKSSSKNVTKVTKNVREQNLLQSEQNFLQREQKKFANQICSKWNKNLYKVSRKCAGMKIAPNWLEKRSNYGLVRPSMAFCDLLWSCIVFS